MATHDSYFPSLPHSELYTLYDGMVVYWSNERRVDRQNDSSRFDTV
jgi:hypothetical protein